MSHVSDIAEHVRALRERITALKIERDTLQAQARSRDEVVAYVDERVAEWTASGEKRAAADLLNLAFGNRHALLKATGSANAEVGSAAIDLGPLMVALVGAKVVRAYLLRGIDSVPVGVGREVKRDRLAAIEQELNRVEREEEAAVEQAERDGAPIQRRPDARPEIVLALPDEEQKAERSEEPPGRLPWFQVTNWGRDIRR